MTLETPPDETNKGNTVCAKDPRPRSPRIRSRSPRIRSRSPLMRQHNKLSLFSGWRYSPQSRAQATATKAINQDFIVEQIARSHDRKYVRAERRSNPLFCIKLCRVVGIVTAICPSKISSPGHFILHSIQSFTNCRKGFLRGKAISENRK